MTMENVINRSYYHYFPSLDEVKNTIDEMIPIWENEQMKWKQYADECPTLYEYLRDNFYNQ